MLHAARRLATRFSERRLRAAAEREIVRLTRRDDMSKSKGFTFTARVMALALAGCAAHTQSANPSSVVSSEVDRKASDDWERFWREHSVSQIPPKSFLDFDAEPLEIMNLSKGLLSDDIVRRWILADI